MTPTVSRWEWRTFGRRFDELEDRLGTASTDVEESDELYLLSPTGENVKVRAGVLDIKVLREVDSVGLQRWEPVVKESFPLSSSDIDLAFASLRQPPPDLGRDVYTLE